ncbi:WecB/TagA/CpsF family glycosyltransferase [Aurantimonas sp. A2-1-M11]|uniref:WecB/TagA/CpsF family glycosyltransferase n=1 Tax=Aurantimonas sp. A2-1-M11 TaxID=3113712 RepID=UPI002F93CBAB
MDGGQQLSDSDSPAAETVERRIAGIAVADLTGDAAIRRLEAELSAGGAPTRLAFLNAHCVNLVRRNASYRQALQECLVLPDGIGVDLAAQLLYGARFRENLNGTDFVPRLLAALERPCRVALIGGAPGVAERAGARFREIAPRHDYTAVSDGYFDAAAQPGILAALERARADIVLVAMGVPAQEIFIARALDFRHGRLFVGVGALFDFCAGNVSRAPKMIRRLRMEWVWRLALEPARLWRRYILGNPAFLLGILRDRFLPHHPVG